MREKEIKNNLYPLYDAYSQYKMLFAFWQSFQGMKSVDDIKKRIEYLTKHKVKQRNELETLLWVIGEVNEENNN